MSYLFVGNGIRRKTPIKKEQKGEENFIHRKAN
jgi:hypothetical protein